MPYSPPFYPDFDGVDYGTCTLLKILEDRRLPGLLYEVKKTDLRLLLARNPISLKPLPYTNSKTLQPGRWVSDVLMNTWLSLLQVRNDRHFEIYPHRASVFSEYRKSRSNDIFIGATTKSVIIFTDVSR